MDAISATIFDGQFNQTDNTHPTYQTISAHNFTQCLSKLASKSIERTFSRTDVSFKRHTLK
jgi:hypothetical protein